MLCVFMFVFAMSELPVNFAQTNCLNISLAAGQSLVGQCPMSVCYCTPCRVPITSLGKIMVV